MSAAEWAVLALLPPALLGMAVAAEFWAGWWRTRPPARQVRHYSALAEQASRGRHPSARPLTGQAAVDQWLADNPPEEADQ